MSAWLAFPWQNSWAAIAAGEVQAVLDDPVYGPAPSTSVPWRRLLAWRGELCPVLEDPALPDSTTGREAAIVLIDPHGTLALRVSGPPRPVEGDAIDGILESEFGPIPVWTRSGLLERWTRSNS